MMLEAERGAGLLRPLAITATGMVTGVGLDAASSCAAIRAAIDNFQETRFMDSGGKWMMGCEVPLEQPWRGTRKLAKMLARALSECASRGGVAIDRVPVLICLAEKDRPGRAADLASKVYFETQAELGVTFHPQSTIIEHGRVGALVALQHARRLIYDSNCEHVLVAGVDCLLNPTTLRHFDSQHRILTAQNSDGFIPGEGAGALLVEPTTPANANRLQCLGLGFGIEEATLMSEAPLRADGLTSALRRAFTEADTSMDRMDFRIVDVAGEQYWFKESALVIGRMLRVHKQGFPLWHITDCIGETGAAIGALSVAYLKLAFDKGFAPGEFVIAHHSNDDGRRAAAVLSCPRQRPSTPSDTAT